LLSVKFEGSVSTFWQESDQGMKQHLTRESIGIILRASVKHYFLEEDASTLMMDALCAWFKVLNGNAETEVGLGADDGQTTPMVLVDQDNDMFILADDATCLLENAALFDLGPREQLLLNNSKNPEDGPSYSTCISPLLTCYIRVYYR
jgi:hypothetical protein